MAVICSFRTWIQHIFTHFPPAKKTFPHPLLFSLLHLSLLFSWEFLAKPKAEKSRLGRGTLNHELWSGLPRAWGKYVFDYRTLVLAFRYVLHNLHTDMLTLMSWNYNICAVSRKSYLWHADGRQPVRRKPLGSCSLRGSELMKAPWQSGCCLVSSVFFGTRSDIEFTFLKACVIKRLSYVVKKHNYSLSCTNKVPENLSQSSMRPAQKRRNHGSSGPSFPDARVFADFGATL